MSKLLYINGNSKLDEYSRTAKIANEFISEYKELNPNVEIDRVDLIDLDLPELDRDVMSAFDSIMKGGSFEELDPTIQDKLVKRNMVLDQFKSADKIVIAAPMWNFSYPAVVKTWIDAIVVANETFKYTENGPIGLMKNKKVVFIQTSGSDFSKIPNMNFALNHIQAVFKFIGIDDFASIIAGGMDMGLEEQNLKVALNEATLIAKSL